ncbi:MAG: SNF2 helicase-associated domain-containing protein [Myxococcota bacterium]
MNIERKSESLMGLSSLLDIDISAMLGDQTLSKSDIEELLKSNQGLVLFKGQWVEVDRTQLQQVLDQWEKIREIAPEGSVSFIKGMRLLAGTNPDLVSEE